MNIEKLKPWIWFKHEETGDGSGQAVPVSRARVENLAAGSAGSLMSLHRAMDCWFDEANADEIKANLDEDVLKLEIPRHEIAAQEVKRISISS